MDRVSTVESVGADQRPSYDLQSNAKLGYKTTITNTITPSTAGIAANTILTTPPKVATMSFTISEDKAYGGNRRKSAAAFLHAENAERSENEAELDINDDDSLGNDKTLSQDKLQKHLARSSTPLTREVVALQRSLNESKILTEYHKDMTSSDARKLRQPTATTAQRGRPRKHDNRRTMDDHQSTSMGVTNYDEGSNASFSRNEQKPSQHETRSLDSSDVQLRYNSPTAETSFHSGGSVEAELDPELDQSGGSLLRRMRSRSKDSNGDSTYTSPASLKLSSGGDVKRTNMRSQNAEFLQKQRKFLKRVKSDQDGGEPGEISDEEDMVELDITGGGGNDEVASLCESNCTLPEKQSNEASLETRLNMVWQPPPKPGSDSFCFKCNEVGSLVACSRCVRCFHSTCIKITAATKLDDTWICPECFTIENILSQKSRGIRRSELSAESLSQLLGFALKRLRDIKGVYALPNTYPEKYIVNPITLSGINEKNEKKLYRCAEEFFNDCKWILHNVCILCTGKTSHKMLVPAKALVKACRQEAYEIETCAECYLNANTRSDWFVDVCAQPHLLLWAKLKGFPYWPAKVMGHGHNQHVNVRFFGKHDRSCVNIRDCYLYSEKEPMPLTSKRTIRDLAESVKEAELHIQKIKAKIGDFKYAKPKTPYDPTMELQQLESMIPGVLEYMKRQREQTPKPSLTYKIVKTADNHLSIIKKGSANDSGNESDHNASATAKWKSESSPHSSNDTKSVIKTSPSETSNYEVVSKMSSADDSKVTGVILKRKTPPSEGNIVSKELEATVPPLKVVKTGCELTTATSSPASTPPTSSDKLQAHPIPVSQSDVKSSSPAKNATSDANPSFAIKRKHTELDDGRVGDTNGTTTHSQSHSHDKHKSKHLKSDQQQQQPVPKVTIVTTNYATAENSVQSVMEHLAKNKQGVTIKKIARDSDKDKARKGAEESPAASSSATVETSKSQTPNTSTKEGVTAATATPPAPTTTDSTTKGGTSAPCVQLLGLLPLTDIKQEPPEDLPADMPAEQGQVAAASTSTSGSAMPPSVIQPLQTASTAAQPDNIGSGSLAPLKLDETVTVKEEVLSDPEDIDSLLTQLSSKEVPKSSTVRVVGDTTIQKINNKSTSTPTAPRTSTPATPPVTTTANTTNNNNTSTSSTSSQTARRQSPRGVPYGPLPANASISIKPQGNSNSATAPPTATAQQPIAKTTNASTTTTTTGSGTTASSSSNSALLSLTTQQQQQVQQLQRNNQQRMRKAAATSTEPAGNNLLKGSITINPQNSQSSNQAVQAGQTNMTTPMASNNLSSLNSGNKRATVLKSGGMVSIPVDVAIQSNNQNSVPIPPLTAVSKTTSTGGTSITTVALPNNQILTAGAATFMAPANGEPITLALTIPTQQQQQQQQQQPTLSITTPPPLAGLSNTSNCQTLPLQTVTLNPLISLMPSASTAPTVSGSDSTVNAAPSHFLGSSLTPALASAVSDLICRPPPQMSSCPANRPLQGDGGVTMFPSQAGPVCRTLVENAHKLSDFFISVMTNTIGDLANSDVLAAKASLLEYELEKLKYSHEQELSELRHNTDLMLAEMRKSMETEKLRLANEIRKQCELERFRSVEETKKKQWCANCSQEAQFYCCWNTSYCDYPCQQLDWPRHQKSCTQTNKPAADTADTVQQQHQQRSSNKGSASASANTQTSSPSLPLQNPINQSTNYNQSKLVTNTNSNSNNNTTNNNINNSQNNTTHITASTKKQKQHNKETATSSSSSNASTAMVQIPPQSQTQNSSNLGTNFSGNLAAAAEVLKLPTNTYLRPVSAATAQQHQHNQQQQQQTQTAVNRSVTNTTPHFNNVSMQRFNLPLVSTAASPYAIVHRLNQWNQPSTATGGNGNAAGNVQQTIAAPLAVVPQSQQQQQNQQQQRLNVNSGGTTTISVAGHGKSAVRQRAGNQNNNSNNQFNGHGR